MTRDFCQHLELYGESYQAASKAYQDCLAAMDEVLAGDRDPALLGQLDVATLQSVLGALPQLKTGRPPAQD